MTEQQPNNAATQNLVAQMGIPGAIIIAGAIIAAAIIFSGGGGSPTAATGTNNQQQTGPTEEELREALEMKSDDYVLGNRDASVYIVEYSDTECPFCKRFHETMNQIVKEYNGEVAWVYRHFPLEQLHRKAKREAQALECAGALGGNEKFWEYTNQLYSITPSNDGLLDSQLPEIAQFVGLDVNAFTQCLESGEYADEVESDFQEAVAIGGRGTPYSFVVSENQLIPINGAQPFATVKAAIDSVLGE